MPVFPYTETLFSLSGYLTFAVDGTMQIVYGNVIAIGRYQ